MDVPGAVFADQLDQVRVQRQVAVVVQVAQRDVLPVPGADPHRRVGVHVVSRPVAPMRNISSAAMSFGFELDSNQYGTTARERRFGRTVSDQSQARRGVVMGARSGRGDVAGVP